MSPGSNEDVTIHGTEWRWDDIAEAVEACKKLQWRRQRWEPRDALVYRGEGKMALHRGQSFDPEKVDFLAGGWDHDHCEICWWKLYSSGDEARGFGYTDGHDWVCIECFEKFLA